MEHPKHCTYVLYSLKDLQFYIGSSSRLSERLIEHEQGKTKSAAPRRPFVPLLCEYYFSKKDPLRREDYFKTSAGKRTLRLMLKESLKDANLKRTSS
jgi:putative endonuclease